jgi:hypothetical protein
MIAHLLGHRHVGTTDRYTHVAVDGIKPLVEKTLGSVEGRRMRPFALFAVLNI